MIWQPNNSIPLRTISYSIMAVRLVYMSSIPISFGSTMFQWSQMVIIAIDSGAASTKVGTQHKNLTFVSNSSASNLNCSSSKRANSVFRWITRASCVLSEISLSSASQSFRLSSILFTCFNKSAPPNHQQICTTESQLDPKHEDGIASDSEVQQIFCA